MELSWHISACSLQHCMWPLKSLTALRRETRECTGRNRLRLVPKKLPLLPLALPDAALTEIYSPAAILTVRVVSLQEAAPPEMVHG
jgi:hypothetical protein